MEGTYPPFPRNNQSNLWTANYTLSIWNNVVYWKKMYHKKKTRAQEKKTSWNKNKKAIRNQTKNYAVL